MKRGNGKQGVSPVVATILLVSITIIIALIVFLWFRGLKGETCLKFDQNIELVCKNVQFFADYNNGELYISNTGNVPIFGIKVKVDGVTSYETFDLSEMGFPGTGLNQGGTFSKDISSKISSDTASVTLIPVLIGSCGSQGEKTYMCNEKDYGYKIPLS